MRGIHDAEIGRAEELPRVTTNQIPIGEDMRCPRAVARFAGDAQLRHRRAKGAAGGIATRVGRDIVAKDAVVVPPRDVSIEIPASEPWRPSGSIVKTPLVETPFVETPFVGMLGTRGLRIGRQERAVHVKPAILLDVEG